jgi:excisionase family DNA binding protein
MKLDPSELDAIADDLAARLVPRLLAELRRELKPSSNESNKLLVSANELCDLVGLSVNTIRARVADGTIPAVKVGHLTKFEPARVIEALRK